ncbi:MAG: rhamnulokinase [Planctomycetota bacterium]|nr:MAG: rhamnulokinase [Planctomycetota bacterium]
MARRAYLAIDIGASSGRHVAGLFDGSRLDLQEVYRFENGPVAAAGHLYWDLLGQWSAVVQGLRAAASADLGTVASVGIDTWGVDFGLLGRGDELLGNPVAYRDARTDGLLERAFQVVPREEIFAETGLQFMQFNTLYQLWAMRLADSPLLDAAERLLMMPDLFHWLLTGEKVNERTNATTTQCFNPSTGSWASELLGRFGIPPHIVGPTSPPGTPLGALRTSVVEATGLADAKVVLPGTHDTASAVMAVPTSRPVAERPDWCYISSGTWSLMGVEVPRPVINAKCLELNFTNEGGVGNSTRLLKNIAGLWLVQQCRAAWKQAGRDYSWDDLNRLSAAAKPLVSLVDPDDASFLAPPDMPEAIRAYCRSSGQTVPGDEGAIIRCALESVAMRCRLVFNWLEELTGSRIETIHIVGGGTQNRQLCQATADACGREVLAGPAEATAIGNVLVQAIAGGDVGSIAEARELVSRSFPPERYEPRETSAWDEAFERFLRLVPS